MSITRFVPSPKFEEYSERFKDHFYMDMREDGVLLVKMWTKGEEVMWSEELHRAIWQMWQTVGADPEVELVIFTAQGKRWITVMDEDSWLDEAIDPGYARYEHMFYDGRRMLLSMLNCVEVPTIGVLSGSGAHTELALMCDLCIMADDVELIDPHFRGGVVPGDGIQIALRELAGIRRANDIMLNNRVVDAQTCLEWGLVNEVVPRDKMIERAYEIADGIMAKNRPGRRLTASMLKHHWREVLADELDGVFGTEMFGDFCHEMLHAVSNPDCLFNNDPNISGQKGEDAVQAARDRAERIISEQWDPREDRRGL